MAPKLDFARLMGEEREDLWRKLCVKDAQATTDLSLVSRAHADDPAYRIDVHSLVLREHEFFVSLLDGGFLEATSCAATEAEGAHAHKVPSEVGPSPSEAAGQAKSSSRKLIKLGISHGALLLLVEWLYTEDPPGLEPALIDTVVALYSAAEMFGLDDLKTQILKERSTWLLADEGPGHSLGTRQLKNAHIFSAVMSEKLALHPLLQDCYLTGFTWKLLEQTTAYDSDLQQRLARFFATAQQAGEHAVSMRDRLLRFMTQCPRSVWNDKPERRTSTEADMAAARTRWWSEEAVEVLDARRRQPMPFIDGAAPYVLATLQSDSEDEDDYY